jgi:hypothetical protein
LLIPLFVLQLTHDPLQVSAVAALEIAAYVGLRIQPRRAYALTESAESLAWVIGPPAAGLLAVLIGTGQALGLDSASFLVSVAGLAAMRARFEPSQDARQQRLWAATKAGLRVIVSNAVLRRDQLIWTLYSVLGGSMVRYAHPPSRPGCRPGRYAWQAIPSRTVLSPNRKASSAKSSGGSAACSVMAAVRRGNRSGSASRNSIRAYCGPGLSPGRTPRASPVASWVWPRT